MDFFADFVPVLIVILLVAVVIILFTGLLAMAIGGRFTPGFRNMLMQTRVIVQGIILIVIVITFTIAILF